MYIFDMHIEEVHIIVAEADKRISDLTGHSSDPLFAVTAWVTGMAGRNLCYGHHETSYLHRDDYVGQPLYRDGDTIDISISGWGLTGPDGCYTAVSMHEEAIFVGFCVPGEYTLRVNDFTKTFRVGDDL